MPAPTNFGLRGHRYLVVGVNSAASQIHRVQTASIDTNATLDVAYELGNMNPVGFDSDAPVPTFSLSKALVGMQMEWLTANKTTGSVTLGDILAYANNLEMRLLKANAGKAVPTSASDLFGMEVITGAGVSRIGYRFTVGGMATEDWTLVGADYYEDDSPTSAWGPFDTVSPGLVRGKNAVLYIGGSASGNTIYRVQSFAIDVDFATQPVYEMGNRRLVGYNVGDPTVSVSFDISESDLQPDALLSTASGTRHVFQTLPQNTIFLKVFDPTSSRPSFGQNETATPIKTFKLDNVVFNVRGMRSQVRGLATKNYRGQLNLAAAAGTGGLTIYNN
jgi:hypothetical protein